MKRRIAMIMALVMLGLAILVGGWQGDWRPAQAQSTIMSIGREFLPPGVTIQTMLTDMDAPVAMAFDPSGRLFYTEKNTGNVRLFFNGTLQPAPVITFKVDNNNERGLLGIAIDPNFGQNHFIYVYYTCGPAPDCAAPENRVARFVEDNGVGTNPSVIFGTPATAPQNQHNGGNIHFGPDGKLYIVVGDNANAANAQDLTVKYGKMHRINPDGSMPTDNPHFNGGGGASALPSLYAIGLRNSFDFTFDPVVPGRIFASENGPGCDDEMNRIEAGYNYGWRADYPCNYDAPDPAYNTILPLWSSRLQCCAAPTGITVYTGNQIPQWHNHLFMAVYQNQRRLYHFYLNEDRTYVTAVNAVSDVVATMDVETGPDGALWYISGGGFESGSLVRLVGGSAAGTPTPQATAPATPAPNPSTTPGTNPPSIPGTGSRTFPETGRSVTGIFLDYWDGHGGLAQQGFPISELMSEVSDLDGKAYVVQYFERAVFEMHPENAAPFNVLLSQLGTFQYKKKYPDGAPNQQPNASAGSQVFSETGKRVGGKFLAYWREHGGLAQQGFPISDEFTEVSDLDGKPYLVQYFERAVFEMHPENGAPYDVLLSQLGTGRYKEKYGGR